MTNYSIEDSLYFYFGYKSFRKGQREIIEAVLNDKNVFAILPTGSGKSICYQLPAIMNSGMVIVISPLLSLMTDQVKQLRATGFKKVAALNSMISWKEKENTIKNLDSYQLIYLSPEMLQSERILQSLSQLSIHLFVIDEAHCISQWGGHEFRPDYLRIKKAHIRLNSPTILALTATATPDVQKDIVTALQLHDAKKIIYPMDKPNISFVVEHVEHMEEKQHKVIDLVQNYHVPTLIYFSSRDEATKIAISLQSKFPKRNIAYYHGGLDKQDRLLIQQQFMNHQLDVICCTNAFGMGINKKDIQLIIHYHIPSQIESFIQEIGRAGREGQECVSVTLYHDRDTFISLRLLETELPQSSLIEYYLKLIYENKIPIEQLKEDFMVQTNGIEAHWRFFRYQLEKIGILRQNLIVTDTLRFTEALSTIQTTIKKRIAYKQRKRQEMLQWVFTKNCRRFELFKHFQDSFQTPDYMCCDHCDFEWNKWSPPSQLTVKSKQNWQAVLKDILYQGDIEKNETS
ncbi:ATP-dependent DNA helicase [Gracilibacillus boraciitolerans JCM 21714]|uniref:ATP-dependent DNA helicase n=1 Tax=Gracilibacillus boraciitolerans JCM 21714 TaxID=1298598 RepID=W4VDP1_9BACI|nr:RecQ family ATP-dependent DNA helicase [Gracilibacillus boraciitolerans]GAE91332.1 ATP-dependent DNA helicase [Gracilibacillus boraciitolerans JCM 21714]